MTEPNPNIRVRFAPSPTGYLHVGGARTALFNWLFACHSGGTLVLRIEDTDFERSTEEMVEGILVGLRWLGLDWDEGPFFQSKRLDMYQATAEKLLASGHAYHCFCIKEQLEARRSAAQAEGGPLQHDCTCRKIDPEEAKRRRAAGEAGAVRFRVPEAGSIAWDDAVFGKVEFANHEIEDFVLLRSDGVPTYHLSVVADDIDMRISHVIRGADHISNTPKQIMQYNALGVPLPVFAHVPLILGPDKTRLSKRHGATSVMAYKDDGILPAAFRNFLALLGWTASDPAGQGKEILSDSELISLFSLEDISRSDAVFDRDKLDWFNTEYIRACPAMKLLPLIQEEWKKAGVTPRATVSTSAHPEAPFAGITRLYNTIDLLKPRARVLKDFATLFRSYFADEYENDPAAVSKFLKEDSVRQMLVELSPRYESLADFNVQSTEQVLRDFAAEKDVKAGVLINGARVALTGQSVAPSLFAVMVALGKERTVARLAKAAALVPTA